jgi:hypothetical protein
MTPTRFLDENGFFLRFFNNCVLVLIFTDFFLSIFRSQSLDGGDNPFPDR